MLCYLVVQRVSSVRLDFQRSFSFLSLSAETEMNVTNTIRARSDSGSSMSSGRSQRGRQGPPVSYRKQFYRPKTTMHMVKELLENRDNLVYDSSHERAGSTNQSSLVRSSSSIAQRAAGLTGDNEKVLTGRQLSTQTDDDDYATITPMLKQVDESMDDTSKSEPLISFDLI